MSVITISGKSTDVEGWTFTADVPQGSNVCLVPQRPSMPPTLLGVPDYETEPVIGRIRHRMKRAFTANPELAETFRSPLAAEGDLHHELLDQMAAGEFRD